MPSGLNRLHGMTEAAGGQVSKNPVTSKALSFQATNILSCVEQKCKMKVIFHLRDIILI